MEPNYQTIRMLLFVSTSNVMWKGLIKEEITREKIAGYVGIHPSAITHWIEGREVETISATNIFQITESRVQGLPVDTYPHAFAVDDEKRKDTLATLNRFRRLYQAPRSSGHYHAARCLGISNEECQKLIDKWVYFAYPMFSEMYYTKRTTKKLKDDVDKFRGLYYLWVRRKVRGTTFIWLCAALHVRYETKIRYGYLIRCKLSAPDLKRRGKLSYLNYDGFLVVRPPRLFWTFERRNGGDQTDFFYAITDYGENKLAIEARHNTYTMIGRYLTTEQNEARLVVDGEVVIQELSTKGLTEDDIVTIMHNPEGRITNVTKIRRLNDLLKNNVENIYDV